MAVSALASAALHTSLGIFTHSHPSAERLFAPSSCLLPSATINSTVAAAENRSETNSTHSTFSSISSSPRQYPTDLPDPILEENDETESEPAIEPVTPVSGRQSRDFNNHSLSSHETHPDSTSVSLGPDQTTTSFVSTRPKSAILAKLPVLLNTPATPPLRNHPNDVTGTQEKKQKQQQERPCSPHSPSTSNLEPALSLSRRHTRGTSASFKRTMSQIFKRRNSNGGLSALMMTPNDGSEICLQDGTQKGPPSRRWSMNRSSMTTRSNTPPSPSSPLELPMKSQDQASIPTVPNPEEFDKSKRASTGFSLRTRAVNFMGSSTSNNTNGASNQHRPFMRRASSFDYSKKEPEKMGSPLGSPWGLPADTGTGLKARRMSLSLPDDFTVDVGDLASEYEYHNKVLGRHGKHLGKGATSKVRLMCKKGFPTELYAVKEFRSKSSSETREEYEKKVKSEYTVAKSLHHPNIIETVRLCTDHGRWNHVMEYCQEGDLLGLLQKGYLKTADREKDRQCLFKQLLQGVNYLHSNGIAHRDIKCENLLITSDSRLKITDFGVSEVFSGIHPGLREAGGQCGKEMGEIRLCSPGICGSPPYISPEVLSKNGPYDPRGLDVWGSAIVMLCLIFGGNMWREAKPENPQFRMVLDAWDKFNAKRANAKKELQEQDYPSVKPFDMFIKPLGLRRLLVHMLNPDPVKRPSIREVMNNRWVRQVECCQLDSYEESQLKIDAAKAAALNSGVQRKIFCHNHLPPNHQFSSHSLGRMPGSAGY